MTNNKNQTEQLLIPEQTIPEIQEPKIQIIDNHAMTSSLDVAAFFGKNHNHVLRDIRKLIEDEPEFGLSNFGQTQNIVEQPNGGTRTEIAYNMSRDGFMMLVMSYTGIKARKIKIRYINRFNEMEALLRGEYLPELDAPSTVADREPLVKLVNEWVANSRYNHPEAWSKVHRYIQVNKAEELTLAQVPLAVAYVQRRVDAAMRRINLNDPQIASYKAAYKEAHVGFTEVTGRIAPYDLALDSLRSFLEDLLNMSEDASDLLGWYYKGCSEALSAMTFRHRVQQAVK